MSGLTHFPATQTQMEKFANEVMYDFTFRNHKLAELKGLWLIGYTAGLLTTNRDTFTPSDRKKVLDLLPEYMKTWFFRYDF